VNSTSLVNTSEVYYYRDWSCDYHCYCVSFVLYSRMNNFLFRQMDAHVLISKLCLCWIMVIFFNLLNFLNGDLRICQFFRINPLFKIRATSLVSHDSREILSEVYVVIYSVIFLCIVFLKTW